MNENLDRMGLIVGGMFLGGLAEMTGIKLMSFLISLFGIFVILILDMTIFREEEKK